MIITDDAQGCRAADRGWPAAPLDTARLRLRDWKAADAACLPVLLGDWEMVRYTTAIPHPYGHDHAVAFISHCNGLRQGGGFPVFAIEDRLTGALIGCIGASSQDGLAVLGYWIARDQWGKGYATEAVRRYLRLLFVNFSVAEVVAAVAQDNPASARVLSRCGFVDAPAGLVRYHSRNASLKTLHFRLDYAAWLHTRAARPLLLVSAGALVDGDGRVLMAQRPAGKSMAGFWEFPGGKLAAGETPEQALVRELAEELGISVGASCLAPLGFASHDYDSFHLLMPLFVCRQWDGQPEGREGQALRWVRPARLFDLPMPPADWPLAAALRDFL